MEVPHVSRALATTANEETEQMSRFIRAGIIVSSFFITGAALVCLWWKLWLWRAWRRRQQSPAPADWSPDVVIDIAVGRPRDAEHAEEPHEQALASADEKTSKEAEVEDDDEVKDSQASEEISRSWNHDLFNDVDLKGIVELGVKEKWYIYEEQLEMHDSTTISGSFGSVRQAAMLGRIPVAVKAPSIRGDNLTAASTLANEMRLFRKVSHPNIICCYGVSILQMPDPTLCLILEWAGSGNFEVSVALRRASGIFLQECQAFRAETTASKAGNVDILQHIQEAKLLADVATGMQYLHSQKPCILHMDLKPQNILCDASNQPIAKIADFGLAMLLKTDEQRTQVGTLRYMAPEVARRMPYSKPADVYSFGCTVAYALTGQHPPKSQTATERHLRLVQTLLKLVHKDRLPPTLTTIAQKCSQEQTSARPTFSEILKLLLGSQGPQGPLKTKDDLSTSITKSTAIGSTMDVSRSISLPSMAASSSSNSCSADSEEEGRQGRVSKRLVPQRMDRRLEEVVRRNKNHSSVARKAGSAISALVSARTGKEQRKQEDVSERKGSLTSL